MSDSALKKWLRIRAAWDPEEMFSGYKGFATIMESTAKL